MVISSIPYPGGNLPRWPLSYCPAKEDIVMPAIVEPKKLDVVDLTKIANRYGNQWIALSSNLKTVYASGETSTDVIAKAKDAGHPDAIIVRLPQSNLALAF